eukprot:g28114.t1
MVTVSFSFNLRKYYNRVTMLHDQKDLEKVTDVFEHGWLVQKKTYVTWQDPDPAMPEGVGEKNEKGQIKFTHTKLRKSYFLLEEYGLFTFDKEMPEWSKMTTKAKQEYLSNDKAQAKEEGKRFAAWVAKLDKVGQADIKILCQRGLSTKFPSRDMLNKVDEGFMKNIVGVSQPPIIKRTLATLTKFTTMFDEEEKHKKPAVLVLGYLEYIKSAEPMSAEEAGGKPNMFSVSEHQKTADAKPQKYELMALTKESMDKWLTALKKRVTAESDIIKPMVVGEDLPTPEEKSEEAFGTVSPGAMSPGFFSRVRSVSRSTMSPGQRSSFRANKIFKQDHIIQRLEITAMVDDPSEAGKQLETKSVMWKKRWLIVDDNGVLIFDSEMKDWNLKTSEEKDEMMATLSGSVQEMEGKKFAAWVDTLDKFGQKDMKLITNALKTTTPSRVQLAAVDENFLERVVGLTQLPVLKRVMKTLSEFKTAGGAGPAGSCMLLSVLHLREAVHMNAEKVGADVTGKPNCFQIAVPAVLDDAKTPPPLIFMCLDDKEPANWLKAIAALKKHSSKRLSSEPSSPSLSRSNSRTGSRGGSSHDLHANAEESPTERGMFKRVLSFSSKKKKDKEKADNTVPEETEAEKDKQEK